jgi:transcriptional regulator
MYIRQSHRPRDREDVLDLVRSQMFATFVTQRADGVIASQLPFVFEETGGEHGTLCAHMARANPHSAALAEGGESLVIFLGPHGYISPAWYVDRATAPTWNYTAVHCYGTPHIHTAEEAEVNLQRLIDVVEANHERPWSIAELNRPEVETMIQNIVSFELRLTRMEAKFKLSQGEKLERTAAAIEQLEASGQGALASYMRRYNGVI